jgi:hypothetical protein
VISSVRYGFLTAASIAIAIMMTWPLGRVTDVVIPASDDVYFSIWRLAWVAHQLPEDPRHLFDANIFYPAKGTLALSDAMLLVGVLGTPFIQAGINPATVHNYLMLAAIVSSMLCAFALARRVTGSDAAAWLAAVIFGLAPYRMAHIGHLELQWTMWMPLAMLLLHRLMEKPTLARGFALGLALAAQVFCSIYYGVFLACHLAVAWLALMPFGKAKGRIVAASAAAIVPLLLVVIVYGPPYARVREQVGARGAEEVTTYSATPSDYLRVPQENALRGRTDTGPAPDERSLFPGFVAISLAIMALIPPISRATMTYLALAIAAADFSLGANGFLFSLLQNVASITTSLRSPARFGVLVLLSISMLAALGVARAYQRWPRFAPWLSLVLTLACLGEYWSAPIGVRSFDPQPTEAHMWLAEQPPGTVILELPAPTGPSLWLHEAGYQLQSIDHWQPMVNGYSAFAPEHFVRLINELPRFPERDVVLRLRQIGVKYILVNRGFYQAEEFDRLMSAVEASSRVHPIHAFGAGEGRVVVLELNYDPE